MTNKLGEPRTGRWLVLLVCLIPVLSCSTVQEAFWPPTPTPTPTATATSTPTPTPTPTRIPLVERDLRDIALQKSDLPDPEGFFETDFPDIELLADELGDSDDILMLEKVEKGFMCYFSSTADDAMYMNFLLIYQNEGDAKTAFDALFGTAEGIPELDHPPIGEDGFGLNMVDSSSAGYAIVWRYREAMVLLGYDGEDDIGVEEMIRMAEAIQARLEEV